MLLRTLLLTAIAPAVLLLASTAGAAETRAHLRRVGSRPPLFSLPDAAGRTVSLRTFLGSRRIVLLFAPGSVFLKSVAEHRAEFTERDLTVLAVASPGSPLTQEDFAPVRVLVDADGRVAREYGAVEGRPAFYLIGKDGHIKMARRSAPATQELFDVIDSMPMRQLEMRERR